MCVSLWCSYVFANCEQTVGDRFVRLSAHTEVVEFRSDVAASPLVLSLLDRLLEGHVCWDRAGETKL